MKNDRGLTLEEMQEERSNSKSDAISNFWQNEISGYLLNGIRITPYLSKIIKPSEEP